MQFVESRLIDDQFYFEDQHFLGKGMYGKVYRGVDRKDNNYPVAIKVIDLSSVVGSDKDLKTLKNEINTMEALKTKSDQIGFDNLVRPIAIKKSKTNLYMVTEYCEGGNLESYLKSKGGYLSEMESIKVMKGVIQGFKVLRDCNIIHRDMKPENVLLSQGQPKIADFGFSRFTEDSEELFMMVTLLGSPLYMAPQILKKQPYTVKCDIWSLGIMFYQMLYGNFPWPANSPAELIYKIENKPLRFQQTPGIGQLTEDFIKRALVVDERNRMDWQEVFNHQLFADRISTLKKSLNEIDKISDDFKRSMEKSFLYTKEGQVIENSEDVRDIAAKFNGQQKKRAAKKWDTNQEMEIETKGVNEKDLATFQEAYKNQTQYIMQKIAFQKCINRIAYERNKIFFINVLISDKLNGCLNKIDMNQHNSLFARILFVLTKYLIVRIAALRGILLNKKDVFQLEYWNEFTQTQEFLEFENLAKIDYALYEKFFKTVLVKCKEIVLGQFDFIGQFPQFCSILNEDINDDPTFSKVFNMVLYEFIVYLKLYVMQNPTDRQLLLLTNFSFLLVRKLSEAFPLNNNMEFDFNKFYEFKEKGDVTYIYEQIMLKYKSYDL